MVAAVSVDRMLGAHNCYILQKSLIDNRPGSYGGSKESHMAKVKTLGMTITGLSLSCHGYWTFVQSGREMLASKNSITLNQSHHALLS